MSSMSPEEPPVAPPPPSLMSSRSGCLSRSGRSEFKAEFEAACQAKGLLLFVLPPRSPKLTGRVERAQRTHKEEFYQMLDPPDSMTELRERLRAQEGCFNTYRPHQALGHLTPQEWLLAYAEGR